MPEVVKAKEKVHSPFISVIIAALNSADTIYFTLSSIFSSNLQKNLYEVIVVDNGSVDATVEIAKGFPVKIFVCKKRGQVFARKMGLNEACGEIICFTDSDVVVSKNWVKKILDFFIDNPEVDGVGGPVLTPLSGHRTAIQKFFGEIYVEDQRFPKQIVKSQFGSYRGALYSANCAYRREAIMSSNGFDESLWDGNDIDVCWRLVKTGRNLVFNPDITVIHLGFPFNMRMAFRKMFIWGRVNIELIKRHFEGYSKLILKTITLSFYLILKDCAGLFCFWENKQKHLLKIYIHLAFTLGRIFEAIHPFNRIPNKEQGRV